jgi:ABC-type amino acid transport substrate-binding protein
MPASAAQLVRIGAAHFPPYTVRPEQGADTGLLPQLVEALNASQSDYQFVAQRKPGREQRYFADLDGKRLAVFSGYHYAFAHFNPDPKYMAEHFNATLTYSHDSNLQMVARDRADIALVTRSYLSDFMVRNAAIAGTFLVSQRIDQVYHHYALLRPGAPITGEAFSAMLKRLRDSGQMLKIFEPYRIDVMAVP